MTRLTNPATGLMRYGGDDIAAPTGVTLSRPEMKVLLDAVLTESDTELLDRLLKSVWTEGKVTPNLVEWPGWWSSARDARYCGDTTLLAELRQVEFPVPSPLYRAERSAYEQALAKAACKVEGRGIEIIHVDVPPARVTVREPALLAHAELVQGAWQLIFTPPNDAPPREYRVTQLTETRWQVDY